MKTLTVNQFADALRYTCDVIIAAEPDLTALDNIVGDGDHGDGMREGFSALKEAFEGRESFSDYHELIRFVGMTLVKAMGGASGVIFGTMFIGGRDAVLTDDGEPMTALDADHIRRFFRLSAEAISRRGKAKANDRTMLDALLHAADAMEASTTEDVVQLLYDGWQGALAGVEATKKMLPRLGRSKNFREHVLGYPDPGAVSTSIIFRSLYEGVSGEKVS